MAYIFDMASGTEHLGEELRFAEKPTVTRTPLSPAPREEHQVELRLVPVEHIAPQDSGAGFPAGLNPEQLIERMED